MLFAYPAIVHMDTDGFWAEFPDLQFCCTQGDSINELIFNAIEAMECFLLDDLEQGKKLPKASNIMDIEVPDNCFVTLIHSDTDLAKRTTSVKKTLTIPSWLNEQALAKNINFSKVLQEALIAKL